MSHNRSRIEGEERHLKAVAEISLHKIRHFNYLEKIKRLKTYAMFISMMAGIVFSPFIVDIRWLTRLFSTPQDRPVDLTVFTTPLLFLMLFVTYCKVESRQFGLGRMHLWLATAQLAGCWGAFFLFSPISQPVAAGLFIVILASTAISSPVITGMLGGNVGQMTSYVVVTNLAIAIVAPLFISLLGVGGFEQGILPTFLQICSKVIPLIVTPFVLAMVVRRVWKGAFQFFHDHQAISFWVWCINLVLLMARTTANIFHLQQTAHITAAAVAFAALGACLLQFYAGRKIGSRFGDTVGGGQALGQKNTILAIWIAQQFLDPVFSIASLAPASYVLWQNIVNSWELYRFNRKMETRHTQKA